MQLTTARRIISAGMEQSGLLGQAISQVRAARKQERQNRKAGRVVHRHASARARRKKIRERQWWKAWKPVDLSQLQAAQRDKRRAPLASARQWREVYGIDPYARLGDAGAITNTAARLGGTHVGR